MQKLTTRSRFENYNDASLLQSQADKLYETLENLGAVIDEREE